MTRQKKGIDKKLKDAIKFNVKNNSQLLWVVGGMIGLLLLFFFFYFFFQSLNKFNFEGLSFTKEKYSQLDVYHYYYNFVHEGRLYNYNLYLRLDPRDTEVIVNKQNGIVFGANVSISINGTNLAECGDSTLAIGELAGFLANNFITPVGAVVNEEEAKANNLTYATCQSKPDMPVIVIQGGNETRIDVGKGGALCSTITIAKCEDVLGTVERYIIESLVDAKATSSKEVVNPNPYNEYQVVVNNQTVAGR